MASLQHDAVPRCGKHLSTSSCLVFVHCKTAKGKDRRWGCGDCRRPEVLSRATSPRGSPNAHFLMLTPRATIPPWNLDS
jgi:hypothetical protein